MKFTASQIRAWRKYEAVRASGRFNMYFPQARAATGLGETRYTFVMDNYVALRNQAMKGKR